MDLQGKMYSKSTCSSTTLFSSVKRLFLKRKRQDKIWGMTKYTEHSKYCFLNLLYRVS